MYNVDIDKNGNKFYYVNNKLHREDGPAIEYTNGGKEWYINGKRHREVMKEWRIGTIS